MERLPCGGKGKLGYFVRDCTRQKKIAFRSSSTNSQPPNEMINFPLEPLQIRFRSIQSRQKPSRERERDRVKRKAQCSADYTDLHRKLFSWLCSCPFQLAARGRFGRSQNIKGTYRRKKQAVPNEGDTLLQKARRIIKTCPNTSLRTHLRQTSSLFFTRLDFGDQRRKLTKWRTEATPPISISTKCSQQRRRKTRNRRFFPCGILQLQLHGISLAVPQNAYHEKHKIRKRNLRKI